MPRVPITVSKNFLSNVESSKHAEKIWEDIAKSYEKLFAVGQDALHKKHAENLYSIELGQKRRIVLLKGEDNIYTPVFYADNHDKYEDFLDNAPPKTPADIQIADTTLDVHFKIADAVDNLNEIDFNRHPTIGPPTTAERETRQQEKVIDKILHDPDTEGFMARPDGTTAYFMNMDHCAIIQVDAKSGTSIIHRDTINEDKAAPSVVDQALDKLIETFGTLQAKAQSAYADTKDPKFGQWPVVVDGGLISTVSLYNSSFDKTAPITRFAGAQAKGFLTTYFNHNSAAKHSPPAPETSQDTSQDTSPDSTHRSSPGSPMG